MPAKGTRRQDAIARGRTLEGAVLSFMNIIVNGKPMRLPDGLTVERLLDSLGVRREYTAVAVNRDITPKHAYSGHGAARR